MRAYLRLYKLRITVTIRSTGRIFNLVVEWICTNPGRGHDLAGRSPLPGIIVCHSRRVSQQFFGLLLEC